MNKIYIIKSISFLIFCFTILNNSTSFSQVLTYDFKNTLTETSGSGADLNVLGSGSFQSDSLFGLSCIQRPVYHFNTNNGLQFDNNLSGNILSKSYSIEMCFKFDSDAGFRRILDFNNQTADSGLYSTAGIVQFYDGVTMNTSIFSGGQYGHLVLTRDSVTQEVSIFVNGSFGASFIDTGSIAVLDTNNVLNCFQDDLIFPGEASSGNIALLKLYSSPLSSGEVSDKFDGLKGTLGILDFNYSASSQCESGNNFTFTNTSDSTGVNINYSWNLGDGTLTSDSVPVHSYLSAGVYNVYLIASYSSGCVDSSSVPVQVFGAPSTILSSDTSKCSADSVLLDAGSGFTSYLWNTGDSTQTIYAVTQGDYYVQITDSNFCTGTDTITVMNFTGPLVDLGVDTVICGGTSINLSAGPGQIAYQWNTGDSTETIIVNTAGLYSVIVTDSLGCTSSDDKLVTLNPPVDLGIDLNICTGDSVTLDAGAGNYLYDWSNGATTQTIVVDQTGNYSVQVTDTASGCLNSDSVFVDVLPDPIVNLGPDFSVCDNQVTQLDAGIHDSYLWSTSETTQTIIVTTSGTYTVTVSNIASCTAQSAVTVTMLQAPQIVFSGDTTLCPNTAGTLDVGSGFVSYLWSTGASTQSVVFITPGVYAVTVANSNGCNATDSITVVGLPPVPTPVISQTGNTLSSTSAFSYQWYEVPGGAIVGASMQDYTPGQNGSFYVITSDVNGCFSIPSDTINFIWSGINEAQLPEITLHPNPASDVININIPSEFKQDLTIRIYNVIGNLVLSQAGASEIDIRKLMKGIYLVQIDTQFYSITTKLIVDR